MSEFCCQIRKWKIEDANDLSIALSNKNILCKLRDGLPFPYTKSDAESYIKAMLEADKNSTYAFAITVNDKVVGSIGVFRKDNIHFRTAEMGYYVAQSYWGKGIGSSAIKQTCEYIFSNTDIIRIFAEPFSDNYASAHVLEKNNFVREGILRSNAIKDGQVKDMAMYALIKE